MADNSDGTAAAADPLAFMEKLSDSVYLYRPSPPAAAKSDPSTPSKAPKLIVVAAWMGARPLHIAKYLVPYRDGLVFGEDEADRPTILLVFNHQSSTLSQARSRATAATAAVAIRSVLGDALLDDGSAPGAPQMLLHIFSNGGCLSASFMYNAVDITHKQCFPAHVTLFDSCPSRFRYSQSVAALAAGLERRPWLQRLLARPVIHLLISDLAVRIFTQYAVTWLANLVLRSRVLYSLGLLSAARVNSPPIGVSNVNVWEPHNVHSIYGGNRREVRRAYLYSRGDKIIPAEDVEEHAAEATRNGFTVASMAEFPGSAHVAHLRTDPARYWLTVRDAWTGVTKP